MRAASWSVMGAVCSRGLAVGANVLVARSIGPSGFGMLSILLATLTLVTSLAGLGFGITATKFVAESKSLDRPRAGRTITLILVASAIIGVAASMLVAATAQPTAQHVLGAPHLAAALRLGSPWIALGVIGASQLAVLSGLEAFQEYALVNVVRGLLGAAGLLIGALTYGVAGAVVGCAIAEAAGVALGHWRVRVECDRHRISLREAGWSRETLRVLRFSVATLLSSATIGPALYLSRVWLVRSPDGYAQAGMYEAANKWSSAILFLPTAISAFQIPLLTSSIAMGQSREYRRVFLVNVGVAAALTVVPGLVVAVAAGPIMSLSGVEFAQGASVLAVLSLSSVGVALNTTVGQGIVSRGRIWLRAFADVAIAAILVATSWVLIPKLGAVGFALATAIAYTAVSVLLGVLEYAHAWYPGAGSAPAGRPDLPPA